VLELQFFLGFNTDDGEESKPKVPESGKIGF
jgi:hypothetical protein